MGRVVQGGLQSELVLDGGSGVRAVERAQRREAVGGRFGEPLLSRLQEAGPLDVEQRGNRIMQSTDAVSGLSRSLA